MVIYKITNKINGKIYIGETIKDINIRLKEHFHGNCRKLKASMRMYGLENFKIETIVRCTSKEEMNHRERLCIKLFKSNINGYNLTDGGEEGKIHSPETIELIKSKLRGVPSPKKGKPGVPWTKERIDRVSKMMTGIDWCKNTGRKHDENFREKCRKRVTESNYKKVINTESGEILNSAKELQKRLDKPYSTIINWLNGTNRNKTTWKYLD